ncbi:hypothetical protein ACFWU3_30840 [Streptomyces sp. NPDC058685]|uniref:hypothetical protein n=1 Tax=Streptomyces sp. NPDC058685 TaxID=3346598 RepID=UPI00365CC45D
MASVVLRGAAALLRLRAEDAVQSPEERWIVDRDETGDLLLAACAPRDVADDGTVNSHVVASLTHEGSPPGAADGPALGAASHMAGLDPKAALMLAAWLDTMAAYADRADEPGNTEAAAPLLAAAMRFAQTYLRTTDDP